MNNSLQNVKLIYRNGLFLANVEITFKTSSVRQPPYAPVRTTFAPGQRHRTNIVLAHALPVFMNDSPCTLITGLPLSVYHSRYPSALPRLLESLPFFGFKLTAFPLAL